MSSTKGIRKEQWKKWNTADKKVKYIHKWTGKERDRTGSGPWRKDCRYRSAGAWTLGTMGHGVASIGALLVILAISYCQAELTPPYFNLATGRKIYATATCGQDTDGPELYCKLVGANTEHDHIDYSVIQGQVTIIDIQQRPKIFSVYTHDEIIFNFTLKKS